MSTRNTCKTRTRECESPMGKYTCESEFGFSDPKCLRVQVRVTHECTRGEPYPARFLSYFFPAQPYFFSISFLPSPISFLFLSCPALFLCSQPYFFPHGPVAARTHIWVQVTLPLFLSYFFPPQPYFFPISFLPSPISLFPALFISLWSCGYLNPHLGSGHTATLSFQERNRAGQKRNR